MESRNVQKAGQNSQQYQAETIINIINHGITEQQLLELLADTKKEVYARLEKLENACQSANDTESYWGSDMFDIANYPNYDYDKIRNIIIDKGNDATHRIWLCKLCEENTYPKLIVECIAIMKNNAEMAKAISTLIEIGKYDTIYCRMLENVITNDRYRSQIIEMYLESGLDRYIYPVFSKMTNNKYIFDVLKTVFRTKVELFDRLYKDGHCFDNKTYLDKMKRFLEENRTV